MPPIQLQIPKEWCFSLHSDRLCGHARLLVSHKPGDTLCPIGDVSYVHICAV
jgi:hypothetical protein